MRTLKSFTVAAALACCLVTTSQAILLVPGATVAPAGPATPPGGAPFVDVFGNGGLDGSVFSWAGLDPANPFGPGFLTFYYQVNNLPPGATAVERFTASGFMGLPVDVTFIPVGGIVPTTADRSFFDLGNVVGFNFPGFGAIPDSSSSQILVVHTAYAGPVSYSVGSVIDGTSDTVLILAPVPETSTMVAGALLLLPFGASALRILRKNRETVA